MINSGILPLVFKNENDYDEISQGDVIEIDNANEQVKNNEEVIIINKSTGKSYTVLLSVSARQRNFLLKGGVLNSLKN